MAEELISTPRITDNGLDNFATPESWEMRPEAKTPGQHLQILTTNDHTETTPYLGNDGSSYSFNGFMDFDMYETPPGAQLFRDQSANDSFDMSYQDMDTPGKADIFSPCAGSPGGTAGDMVDFPEDSPLQTDIEGGYSAGGDAQNYTEIAVTIHGSSPQAEKGEGYSANRDVQDYTDIASNADVQIGQYDTEEIAEKCIKLEDSGSQKSFDENEVGSQQHRHHGIEECILERLDQESYPQKEKEVEERNAETLPTVMHQPFEYEHLISPQVESLQDAEIPLDKSSSAVIDGLTTEVCCPEKTTEHHEEYLNMPHGFSRKNSDVMVGCQEEAEVPTNFSPILPENKNSSLISMGAPQNAEELDQLADFLNMDDPFTEPEPITSPVPPGPCTIQPINIASEELKGIPIDVENIVSLPAPAKRKKRGKKVASVSERRRSVRIARRESLLNKPDVGLAKDIAETLQTYQNNAQGSVTDNFQQQHGDRVVVGHESHDIFHQEMRESSSALDCTEINTFDSSSMEGPFAIKEPMTQKRKKKTNSGRRRSVRLLKQDTRLDEETEAVAKNPGVQKEEAKCDNVFLANFADFGLGDDWMPGDMFAESQFAKTPRDRSSRRKSARLSGVHVPLLELKNKSEVKVYGVDEVPEIDGPNDFMGNSHVLNPALTLLSKPSMISICESVHDSSDSKTESVTELSLQKQEAVKSSKKKESCSKRRRSIRLAKKPEKEPKCIIDSEQENQNLEPHKKATNSYKRKEILPDNILQEVKIWSSDNVFKEPVTKGELFTVLKTHVDDLPMDQDDCLEHEESSEVMDFQEVVAKSTMNKDTPLMGRKRVSRISEKDKEIDDAQAKEQSHPKKRTSEEKNDDSKQDYQRPQKNIVEGAKVSSDNKFQVSNKVKSMYLKRGAAGLKKHNLETIFESPKKRATGTPVNLLGGKKMKRSVVFTETPWLGRTGRTKGRKVKKGKQVKRVLNSTVEKSWKLDIRLSDLDILSP